MKEADTREKDPVIRAGVDKVTFLKINNPDTEGDAHPFSFDLRVTTACDEVLGAERKRAWDLVGSIDKIERQCSYPEVHMLIIEGWNHKAMLLACGGDPKRMRLVENVRKRVRRLQLQGLPVIWTDDAEDTIAFLRYIEGKTEPLLPRRGSGASAVIGDTRVPLHPVTNSNEPGGMASG